jgi:hypothetical protein
MNGTELLAKQDDMLMKQEKFGECLLATLQNYLDALKNQQALIAALLIENHDLKGKHSEARDRSVT